MEEIPYLSCRLLRQYKHRGAPVVLVGKNWTEEDRQSLLARVRYWFDLEHANLLRKDFTSILGKGQRVVLLYSDAWNIPGLCLRPLGVKEERYRWSQ